MRVHLFYSMGIKDVWISCSRGRRESTRCATMADLFRTPVVGQRIMAATIDTGFAYGAICQEGRRDIALLAAYGTEERGTTLPIIWARESLMAVRRGVTEDRFLPMYVEGFDRFLNHFWLRKGLAIERCSSRTLLIIITDKKQANPSFTAADFIRSRKDRKAC